MNQFLSQFRRSTVFSRRLFFPVVCKLRFRQKINVFLQMSEIADLTYNVVAFSEIMQMIWKRLNDHGKNWRHVYKSLVLLEYLIKTGSEKVSICCLQRLSEIRTSIDFRNSKTVWFPNSSDFRHCLKSKLIVRFSDTQGCL